MNILALPFKRLYNIVGDKILALKSKTILNFYAAVALCLSGAIVLVSGHSSFDVQYLFYHPPTLG